MLLVASRGRRFKSCPRYKCDVSRHRRQSDLQLQVRLLSFWGSSGGSFRGSGGLVVAVGVEDQFAEEFAGGCVDDADLEVLDEQDDAGSGVAVRPMPMWCSRLLCRRVTEPALSMRSCRIRSWVSGSVAGPGSALGMVS